ncbi:ribosome small subunit-dependent GTPase A [Miltoncostaea marina]|uniref:ribosome small subunit-dependent GTPase A n=1 Tax=Miltoncostaea marina TaxID=2843215 RepID=UPI001C3C4AC9|nr:ribosome small subunit-dependent GTPase A [Miltoncostaea marina]
MTPGGGTASEPEALVVRVSGPTATVAHDGEEREARLVPRVPGGPAVAGDRVLLRPDPDTPVVVRVLPRRTVLERGDGHERRPRAVVANADLLIVVAAVADPPLRPRLLDRYLVAGEVGGLEGAVALTKTDLPHDSDEVGRVAARYRAIGVPVLAGCTRDPGFVAAVRELVDGRTAILAGHSGVGKSSLTRALTGVERAVGEISGKVRTGRHTTTDPRVIPVPGGGAVVDTAGVRTFHLPRMDRATLESGFPEIAAAAAGCRFRGCAHDGDAGCAVPGAVSPERLDAYRRMLADMR